jgi:chemotaxis protein MotB
VARKKKPEDPPLGAPLWLATFADMATLMLTFFIMLLSFSSIQESKFNEAAASLTGAFGVMQNPPTVIEQPEVLIPEPRKSDVKEILYELQKMRLALAEEGLEHQVDLSLKQEGILISISTPYLFRPAEADLLPQSEVLLTRLGDVLHKVPNLVRVEGHTDNVPIASDTFPSNWELSTARAIQILKSLAASGVAPGRLSAAGYAEFRPVASNGTELGRSRNRRVEILVQYESGEETGSDPAKPAPDRSATEVDDG